MASLKHANSVYPAVGLAFAIAIAGCGRFGFDETPAFDGSPSDSMPSSADGSVADGAPSDAAGVACTTAGPTLVAWYQFEDDLSDGAADRGPNGIDATCVDQCPTIASGVIGNGADFGSAVGVQGLAAETAPTIDFSDGFTITMWIRSPAVAVSAQTLIVKPRVGALPSFALQINPTGTLQFDYGGVGVGQGDVDDNDWRFIAATWTPTLAALRVDGFTVDATPNPAAFDDSDITIGIEQAGGIRNYNGVMDDVRIYGRALESSELNTLAACLP